MLNVFSFIYFIYRFDCKNNNKILFSVIMAVCMNCHILLRPTVQLHQYFAVDLSQELVFVIEEWCGREVSNLNRESSNH